MQKKLGRNTVVLLGIGHTNAHVLRMWKMNPPADTQLVCVSNFPNATYSGMLPGVLAGQYEPAAMEIDLVRLANSAGARLVIDEVVGIDHQQRQLLFANRPSLAFDVLSIGVGSVPTFRGVDVQSEQPLVAIKPMQTFLARLKSRFQEVIEPNVNRKPKVVVVGGGLGSIEIAFCLKRRSDVDPQSLGLPASGGADVVLLTGSGSIGAGLIDSTREKVAAQLAAANIESVTGSRVAAIHEAGLTLVDGREVSADVVLWATSAAAPPLLSQLSLETDESGFVKTKPTLQSVTNDRVFAVGDTGTIVGEELPKAGVFAVREGPVLWDNIRRVLWGRKVIDYRPQRDFLKLINTADGKAIAEFRGRSFSASFFWWLKNRIDVKFMEMYQDYSLMEMVPEKPASREEAMRCLGCGGKIGSKLLSTVLDELDVPPHEDVEVGLEHPDDAAVIRTHDNRVTVTTDFFASPMDDPYLVGRIALLNSASDCCVMGAQPTAALAIVQLPLGHPRAQLQVMRELMAGSIEELKKMKATIVGGHSIEGPRLTIGFTVLAKQLSGVMTKGMLRGGDHLVLTKPLGSGVLLAGLMQGQLPGPAYSTLVNTMLQSNYIALELIQRFKISGITDVTGFGLAGHLIEMLRASGKSAAITMADVPLLPECQRLIEAGVESTLAPENRFVTEKVNFQGDLEAPQIASLFDPQTSGGLLFGVGDRELQPVLDFLRSEGLTETTVIGVVEEQQPGERETLRVV